MTMTSRKRVIASINHKKADRIPRDFSATASMYESLMKHYNLDSEEKFNSEVEAETTKYIDILYQNGGYIVAPSQALQVDIPI